MDRESARDIVENFYKRRHKKNKVGWIPNGKFFDNLIERLEQENNVNQHNVYQFLSHIIVDETSEAIRRTAKRRGEKGGYKKLANIERFLPREGMDELYKIKRKQVLKALTRKASKLFSCWGAFEPQYPADKNDTRSVYGSLAKYFR